MYIQYTVYGTRDITPCLYVVAEIRRRYGMKCLDKTLADIFVRSKRSSTFPSMWPHNGRVEVYTESGVWFRSLSLVNLSQRVQFSSVVRKCFFQSPPRLRFEMDCTVSSISTDLHCILVPSTARTYLKQQSPLNLSRVWSGFFRLNVSTPYYHPITLCNRYIHWPQRQLSGIKLGVHFWAGTNAN